MNGIERFVAKIISDGAISHCARITNSVDLCHKNENKKEKAVIFFYLKNFGG